MYMIILTIIIVLFIFYIIRINKKDKPILDEQKDVINSLSNTSNSIQAGTVTPPGSVPATLTRIRAQYYAEAPENEYLKNCKGINLGTDKDGIHNIKGISFSGGGVRAASAALGFLQVLNKHRLLSIKKIQYLTANSGGTWALLPMAYVYTGHTYPRDQIIGTPVFDQDNINWVPTGSTAYNIIHQDLDGLNWGDGVGRSFFEPYSLYRPGVLVNIKQDFNVKILDCKWKDFLNCHKQIDHIVKREDFPIPISIMTFYNSDGDKNDLIPMDASPLSTGFLRKNTSTLDPSNIAGYNNYAGRNTSAAFNSLRYENVSFNNKTKCNNKYWYPDNPVSDFKLDVNFTREDVNARPWQPTTMSATSSNAAGKGLADSNRAGSFVIDLYRMDYSPYQYQDRKSKYLIDGAYTDNSSSVCLFSRKVKNIAICVNNEISVLLRNTETIEKGKYYFLMTYPAEDIKNINLRDHTSSQKIVPTVTVVPIYITEVSINEKVVDSVSYNDKQREVSFNVGGGDLNNESGGIYDLYGKSLSIKLQDGHCEIYRDKNATENCGEKTNYDGSWGGDVQRKKSGDDNTHLTMFNVSSDKKYYICDIRDPDIHALYSKNILKGTYSDVSSIMNKNYYNTGLYYYNGPVSTNNNIVYNIKPYTANVLMYSLLPCFSVYNKWLPSRSLVDAIPYAVNFCTSSAIRDTFCGLYDEKKKSEVDDIPNCYCIDDKTLGSWIDVAKRSEQIDPPYMNLVISTTNYASEQLLVPFANDKEINPNMTATLMVE